MTNMLWWIPFGAIVVLLLHELSRPEEPSAPTTLDLTALLRKRKR